MNKEEALKYLKHKLEQMELRQTEDHREQTNLLLRNEVQLKEMKAAVEVIEDTLREDK